MQRIYLPNIQFLEDLIISEKELYHQITRVMRARVGQEFVFFDGDLLQDHVYRISDINKNQCVFHKQSTIEKDSEAYRELTLYQALPSKLSKLEYIVQKCSEVGYKRVIFFQSERTQPLVISDSKKLRLEKIAIESGEQCGGNKILKIDFKDTINDLEGEVSFICHTNTRKSSSLNDLKMRDKMNLIVGPEGGFSDGEVDNFQDMGAQKIYLGNRVLRCETVGEVVGFYFIQKK